MCGSQNMQLLNLALTLEWNLLFRQLNMFRLVWYPLLVGYFVHIYVAGVLDSVLSEERYFCVLMEGSAITASYAYMPLTFNFYCLSLQNWMDKALRLFNSILKNKWFLDTSVILFLNKKDLFEQKIKERPLPDVFPHFRGMFI